MDSGSIWRDAEVQLEKLRAGALDRHMRHAISAAGPVITFAVPDGKQRTLVNFSSNNYLDLAAHPRVVARTQRALEQFGAGAGGSRLITGSMQPHEQLERHLAAFKGTEAALVFSSGYMANLALVQALATRADGSHVPIFFDRLAHASIVDAAMGTRSRWRSFVHNDVAAVERLLARPLKAPDAPTALVITEGVFSMDGDMPPLGDLLSLCEQYRGLLILDDAHGTGTVGPGGRGAAAAAGVSDHPNLVQMGTLSKALGSMGGYVAGPAVLIELLMNRGRAFVFDTALAPAAAAAADEALTILDERPDLPQRLQGNARAMRVALQTRGVGLSEGSSPVVPVIVGEADLALQLSRALQECGYLVIAIRPPTVPRGTSRLRISVMSSHTQNQIEGVAAAIANSYRGL